MKSWDGKATLAEITAIIERWRVENGETDALARELLIMMQFRELEWGDALIEAKGGRPLGLHAPLKAMLAARPR